MSCETRTLSLGEKIKKSIRGWIETGYDRQGECNFCGDCCHTIWMCGGMKTIDEPLDIPCSTCGEGALTQSHRVTCPYLTEEEVCGVYVPGEGLPYNCCENFPQVKDILWHPDFYDEMRDCDFHLVRKKLSPLLAARRLLLTPFLWFFLVKYRRKKRDKTPSILVSKDGNVIAPEDPKRRVEPPAVMEV